MKKLLILILLSSLYIHVNAQPVQIQLTGKTIYVHPLDSYISDQFLVNRTFWSQTEQITGANDPDDGKTNTEKIVEVHGLKTAAGICDTLNAYGFSDWYLPAQSELLAMNNYKLELNFHNNPYWSSTELNNRESFEFYFENNAPYGKKLKIHYDYNVRCIRSESVITGNYNEKTESVRIIRQNENILLHFPEIQTQRQIEIYDSTGKLISSLTCNDATAELKLAEGINIIRIVSGTEIVTEKIIR